jgi:hypothetical protein
MREEYQNMNEHEALKVENEVIKMKLMLEHGAEFRYSEEAAALSAETEHEFLNYIMDFEQQEALAREDSVFEVLGRPQHFPKEETVHDDEIKEVLQDLLQYMKSRGIEITVFSPNVKARELYRFVTEELFQHRMLHMNMPGMITCFIYDEFHPDYPYENSRTAVNECLKEIFDDDELQWTFQYEQVVQINDKKDLTIDSFRRLINAFKKRFNHIEPLSLETLECVITGDQCVVSGKYEICFTTKDEHLLKMGQWNIRFRYWDELDIWMIYDIQVDGIEF